MSHAGTSIPAVHVFVHPPAPALIASLPAVQIHRAKLAAVPSSLEAQLFEIIAALSAAAPSVQCPWDSTLLDHTYPLLQSRFLLAANFKDSSHILPQVRKIVTPTGWDILRIIITRRKCQLVLRSALEKIPCTGGPFVVLLTAASSDKMMGRPWLVVSNL